jgi:hypothetical protein
MRSFVICDWNAMKPMGIRWKGQREIMGEKRNACRNLVRKPEGNIPPSRWGLAGKIILQCILKREGEKTWTGLVWLRTGILVSTVMNFGIFWWPTISFSIMTLLFRVIYLFIYRFIYL